MVTSTKYSYGPNKYVFGKQYSLPGGRVTSVSSASTLDKLSDAAAIWGKPIPLSGGKRKLRGYMLQMGPVEQRVVSTDVNFQVSTAGYWQQTETVNFGYFTSYAFALGYPGDGGQPKTILRVWQGDQLIFSAGSGNINNQPINFYPGSQTQVADPVMKRSFPDQLAYRGLMYGVLPNLAADTSTGNVPDIFVELTDNSAATQPVTSVSLATFVNSLGGVPFLGGYDSREGYLYLYASLPTVGNGIVKANSTTGTFLQGVPFSNTGIWPGWNGGFRGTATCFFYGEGPQDKYFFSQSGTSNCLALGLVNAETGAVVATLGAPSGFPNVLGDIYGGMQHSEAIVFRQPGRTRAFVCGYSTLFGNDGFIIKAFDTVGGPALKRVNYIGSFSGTGRFFRGQIDADGTCNIYFVHGTAIDRYRIDRGDRVTVTTNWATGGVEVIGGLLALDGNPVFFENDGSGTTRVYKLDAKNPGTKLWELVGASQFRVPTAVQIQALNRGEWAGKEVFYPAAGKMCRLDLMAGQFDEVNDVSGESFDTNNPPFYDAYTGRLIRVPITSTQIRFITARSVAATRVLLSDFLLALCVNSGYSAGNVQISGITDFITGYILYPPFTLQDVLADLGAVYNFEFFEADGKIQIKRRARGSSFVIDATIPFTDWAVLEEGGQDDFPTLQSSRASDDALPAAVELSYIDEDYDYNVVSYTWRRPGATNAATGTAKYGIPIVMKQSEAGALVANMVYELWNSRVTHQFRLPPKYLRLAPGDVVRLVGESYTDTVKITKLTVNGDFSISCQASSLSSDAGQSYSADPFQTITTPPLDVTGRALVLPVDIPVFPYSVNPTSDLETLLLTLPASRGTFLGGLVGKAGTDGVLGEIGATAGTVSFGRMPTILGPDSNPNSVHYGQTFSFVLQQGALTDFQPCTVLEMLADKNLLLYGQPGRWEIVAFSTVSVNTATNTVTLGDFIRGLHGTDNNIANHAAGDYIILFDQAEVLTDRTAVANIGQTFTYRSAGLGLPLVAAYPTSFTLQGNSDKPFPVATPKAVKSGSDLVFTWNGRARDEPTLYDGSGVVTLTDLPERYDLEIYNSGGTLVRTASDLTTPTYTYLSANIASDGFTFATLLSIRVVIYQKSATLGRGFPKDVTLYV